MAHFQRSFRERCSKPAPIFASETLSRRLRLRFRVPPRVLLYIWLGFVIEMAEDAAYRILRIACG
jgi:hypothetical protein